MKNTYIDQIYDRIQDNLDVNEGERELVRAYKDSIEKGFEGIIVFDALPRERKINELVAATRAAEVKEIYITGDWSNHLWRYLLMDELGLKLRGIVRLKNAKYETDMNRWGESYEPESIPALHFSF